jgi:hypothetical protein
MREVKKRRRNEYRCNERLKAKAEESTCLACTGLHEPKDIEIFLQLEFLDFFPHFFFKSLAEWLDKSLPKFHRQRGSIVC